MSLFALGDTHLSLRTNKPMDIFNGWNDYVERLEKNWRAIVKDDDTVVDSCNREIGKASGMSKEKAAYLYFFK